MNWKKAEARYHSVYGVYGISVFAVRDVTIDELAQQAPLARFDRLSLLTVRDVLAAGMRLEPTGRNPRRAERLPRRVTW